MAWVVLIGDDEFLCEGGTTSNLSKASRYARKHEAVRVGRKTGKLFDVRSDRAISLSESLSKAISELEAFEDASMGCPTKVRFLIKKALLALEEAEHEYSDPDYL